MDSITGLPPSGPESSSVLLVFTDRLSKGIILIPVAPNLFDAERLANLFIKNYFPHYWIPHAIVSDRGPQFVNAFWNTVTKLLGIQQRLSTAYHPETDGSTERANQELETYLRTFVALEQNDWISWIPLAQIALNNKPNSSTQISPFFMSHGYDARAISTLSEVVKKTDTPAERGNLVVNKLREAHEIAQTAMVVAQQTQEKHANLRREEYIS